MLNLFRVFFKTYSFEGMLSLPIAREKMLTGGYTRKFLPTDKKIERENNKTFGHKKMEGFWVNAEPCCASIFCWRTLYWEFIIPISAEDSKIQNPPSHCMIFVVTMKFLGKHIPHIVSFD